MQADQLRSEFIKFFIAKPRNHQQIPSASLLPENDPTTLFTSSGMQPLVPYLLGEAHPLGKRLVDSQCCFRSNDINEVGDNRHTTFFEMLGNWSLGDYFKQEQLSWFWQFLTQVVGLDPKRLYVSVFAGSQDIPQDEESIAIWQKLFKINQPAKKGISGFDPQIKIYTYVDNWWSRSGLPKEMPPGEIGGPDSEVFYDFGQELGLHEKSVFRDRPCHLNCDCGRFLEIGNSVFIEYKKTAAGNLEKLPNKNVDFGGGLERILAAKQRTFDIFKTDLFWPIIEKIAEATKRPYVGNESAMRVIVDHLRAATFMIAEGLEPSNKQAGYILRRLLRRAAVKRHLLTENSGLDFTQLCSEIVDIYDNQYFQKEPGELKKRVSLIIHQEMGKFTTNLHRGLSKIKKVSDKELTPKFAFDLFQTYGFPVEVTEELFKDRGKTLDKEAFDEIYTQHQQRSRTASQGMFKGGLADHSEAVTKLHTVTHLLHAALRQVLGDHVQQVGSNITAERLRFDFTHQEQLTAQQLQQVEDLINQQIDLALPIELINMSLADAKAEGALAFFGQKYPDQVKVYTIGSFSKELCGGPHVNSTKEIGKVKIIKQESCGAGRRRIYARILN